MSEYRRVRCWPILRTMCVLLCCSAQYKGNLAVDCRCSVARHIRIVNETSGTCVTCWDCPDCPEGTGSTVECGATVPVGTNIECVHCVDRFNYSDTHGRGQCRPCSVCSNHEHIERECDSKTDIKCGDCKSGFVREPVVKDCVPTTTHSVPTANQTHTPVATVAPVTNATTSKRNVSTGLRPVGSSTSSITPTSEENSGEVDNKMEHDGTGNHTTQVDKVFIIAVLICIGIAVPICIVLCRRYPLFNCSRRQFGNYSVSYTSGQDQVQIFPEDLETGGLLQEGTPFKQRDETSLKNPFDQLLDGNPTPHFNTTNEIVKFVSQSADNTQDLGEPDKATRPPTCKREASYDMKISQVPYEPLLREICMMLDVKRDVDGKDYRMLASELGLTNVEINYLETCDKKTHSLLMQTFTAKENSGTVNDLVQLLKRMGRHDVIEVIDKWVYGSS